MLKRRKGVGGIGGSEKEQTTEQMLDADKKEEKVLKEHGKILQENEPSTTSLSDVLASLVIATAGGDKFSAV